MINVRSAKPRKKDGSAESAPPKSPTASAETRTPRFPVIRRTVSTGTAQATEIDTSQHCAGAMIVLDKIGNPNIMMRRGAIHKVFDAGQLKGKNSVFDTLEEFVEHHS